MVASPTSGAIALIGLLVKSVAALISIIFLIGIHQLIYHLMQCIAYLCLVHFHQQTIFQSILSNLLNFGKIFSHHLDFFGTGNDAVVITMSDNGFIFHSNLILFNSCCSASPRWLILFFTSMLSSAPVLPLATSRKMGS